MSDVVIRAAEFARRAHASIDQRRKYTHAPYIVHPKAVADIVAGVTDDPAMIAAAWLHDVVEDTPITIAEVEELVEVGELDPDQVHTPSIFVQRIVQGTNYEKRIEKRTVRKEA